MLVVLAVFVLALIVGAIPAPERRIPISETLQMCRAIGVDIRAYGVKEQLTAGPSESKNLRKCFDILVMGEQTSLTEVAMLGVLVKRLQAREALGEPIFELLAKGQPSLASKQKKAKAVVNDKVGDAGRLLSRHKRQYPLGMGGALAGGGEIGEDPGKRLKKMRLGLPLGEVGEDPGKRLRQQRQRQPTARYNPWYYYWYYNAMNRYRHQQLHRNRQSKFKPTKKKAG